MRSIRLRDEDGEVARDVLDSMLSRVVPTPSHIKLIRARIYTHNGRLARYFARGAFCWPATRPLGTHSTWVGSSISSRVAFVVPICSIRMKQSAGGAPVR